MIENENLILKKEIVKNSFWSLSSVMITKIGALVFTIILARFLMPESYGIYTIVLSTAMIFYTFADLGINKATLRYLSFALKKNRKQVSSYYRYLLKIKLIMALVASILLLILSYPLSYYFFKNPKLFLPFLVASFYIFVLALEAFHTRIFYAIEKIKYVSLKEMLHQFLRIIFALAVFYLVASSYQIVGIFLTLIFVSIILVIFCLFYFRVLIPGLYKKSKEKIDKKRVLRFVGFLTIASISMMFFSHIDSIMLGVFLIPEYVGYYGVAISLVLGVTGIASFANALFLPLFTKLEKSKRKPIFDKAFKYLAIITIPLIFGLLLFGKYFIKILFGVSYLPAALPLYFLSFLVFPVVSMGLFLALFFADEKSQIFAKLVVMTLILNVILNFILIKSFLLISSEWATTGAAIATLISWFFYFFMSVYTIKKEFNFSILFKSVSKPLFASLVMFGVLFYLLRFIKDMNFLWGAGVIFLGVLIYFIVMFFTKGILKEDLMLLKLLIKR